MSADERTTWLAVAARRVAAPTAALLLGAAAMALLLDSGTPRLPSAGSGSRFASPPPEKAM